MGIEGTIFRRTQSVFWKRRKTESHEKKGIGMRKVPAVRVEGDVCVYEPTTNDLRRRSETARSKVKVRRATQKQGLPSAESDEVVEPPPPPPPPATSKGRVDTFVLAPSKNTPQLTEQITTIFASSSSFPFLSAPPLASDDDDDETPSASRNVRQCGNVARRVLRRVRAEEEPRRPA